MDASSQAEAVRWLQSQLAARGLKSLELTATLRHRGQVYDDTLVLTDSQGEVSFGSLPVGQRRHAESFLRGLYASDARRGNLELSVVCLAGEARPRIVLNDELRQREAETERAWASAHFDSRPYGRELAREVAAFVDTRGPLTGFSRSWRGARAEGFSALSGGRGPPAPPAAGPGPAARR